MTEVLDDKAFEVDKLLYQNINTYRLHADNLRFQLFLGYLAAFVAILSYLFTLKDVPVISTQAAILCIALYLVSLLYMLVLAVQNWFYILFAKYMGECETRLRHGIHLRTLQEFTSEKGCKINPNHPAFNFVLLIYCILESILGFLVFVLLIPSHLTYRLSGLMAFGILCLHVFLLSLMLIKWNTVVYESLIVKFSALFFAPEIDEQNETNEQHE